MLIYTADDIRTQIDKFNNLSIEDYLNLFVKRLFDERLFCIHIPLTNYSKNDIVKAKDLLKEANFKFIFNKGDEGQYESITVIV